MTEELKESKTGEAIPVKKLVTPEVLRARVTQLKAQADQQIAAFHQTLGQIQAIEGLIAAFEQDKTTEPQK